jgi:glyoxylase-like metal-dependent hydrolase (beta-lactamase superfamily II)
MDFFKIIDLQFLGYTQAIAVYLFPHPRGLALIETGPGSTLHQLHQGLQAHGYSLEDITDVFLTHIHLDHAGASGALARHGARIHVHPCGAPHLIDPEKLLSSAQRIYGADMDRLWGEFLPVPEDQVNILEDGDRVQIGELTFRAIDTPGHANHHHAYLVNRTCFCGDIGGIRLPGSDHLRLPMPPPELNLEKWRASLARLEREELEYIAPTHFGVFDDPARHLQAVRELINNVEEWLVQIMPADPDVDTINKLFLEWTAARSEADHLSPAEIEKYEAANPSWMSAAGIQRYWRKYRLPG